MKVYQVILAGIAIFAVIFTSTSLADVNNVSAASFDPNGVAVTVNGDEITEGQINDLIQPQLKKMSAQLPPQFLETAKKQLRQRVLQQEITEALLNQQVEKSGIKITEQNIDERLKTIASQQNPPLDLGEFKKLVESYGQDYDQLKERVKKGLAYEKVMEKIWGDKINVTKEDAQKYYEQNKKQFQQPEQIRASHILIKPETSDPNADKDAAKAEAKAEAEKVLEKVKKGEDFAELAKKYSDGPSAKKGGDLNFFSKGRMVPSFEKAAFALDVGQTSDIVETRFGYHIIKVTDHKEASTTTFEEAKDKIIEDLTNREKQQLAKEYIDALKKKADIVYPEGKEPQPAQRKPRPMTKPSVK